MRLGRTRILAASIAAATMLGGALAVAATPAASAGTAADAATVAAGAAGPRATLSASAATPLPDGAARLGPTPAAATLTVEVALNLGNQAGLDALLNGLADKKSPYYRHFLAKGQFGPEFGLSLTQIAQVTAALRALGLDPGPVDPSRLDIPVTATAAALDRAFGVGLTDYRLAGGRIAYANAAAPRVPASVAPYIEGVLGLDNVYLAQRLGDPVTTPATARPAGQGTTAVTPAAPAAPRPCTAATDAAVDNDGYTADQFASHYFMTALYRAGDYGQGVRVAVAELDPNLTADITAYEACYGIHTKVNDITVNPGMGKGAGDGEAALDIENIAGLAPDVTIDDYQSPNTTLTALLDIAQKVLDNDKDQVLSISYGLCEDLAGSSLLQHYQTVFKALNAQGITVLAGAGDDGPAGCYDGGAKAKELSADSPASANYVIAVGGTSMENASQLSPETAWNGTKDAPGAGGGGVSRLCMPFYQDRHQVDAADFPPIPGLIAKYSKTYKGCKSAANDPHGYLRELPDVSADASGNSPYIIYYDGAWDGFYGTSGSTTLVAAEAALIDASPFCSAKGWDSGPAGLLPQGLYGTISDNVPIIFPASPATVVLDITKGNTDDKASGYTGGLYPATAGYDMATGLGAPLLAGTDGDPYFDPGMAANMCAWYAPANTAISTHGVYPNSARAGRSVTVTVRGTGMLEFAGSDQVNLNTNNNTKNVADVWANCATHTRCRVTLPAERAGTYQVELIAASFLPCGSCKAYVTFRFVNAPRITRMSADSGRRGTKITIRGRNFIGVSGVYFGTAKGTGLRVLSSTELTVDVPAGSGRVKVTVVAAGGRSNAETFTY